MPESRSLRPLRGLTCTDATFAARGGLSVAEDSRHSLFALREALLAQSEEWAEGCSADVPGVPHHRKAVASNLRNVRHGVHPSGQAAEELLDPMFLRSVERQDPG